MDQKLLYILVKVKYALEAFKEVVVLLVYSMLTVSLVHGIVIPRTTSYALNDNIQLKYLGYFHDILGYL